MYHDGYVHPALQPNGFLAKFAAVSMGSFFIGIIVTITIGFFGLEHAQHMYAPVYYIMRTINLRLETIWMLIIVSAGIIASANLIWAFSLGISQIVGLSTYKPLVFPAALISLMLCLASFDNNIELMNFAHYTFPLLATFVEGGLEIFLFVSALVLNKRGKILS